MPATEISGLQAWSSLTYVDMLGLLAGLERLNGETSDHFLERIRRIVRADRTLTWKSALVELASKLDLPLYPAFQVLSDRPVELRVGWSGLRILDKNGETVLHKPMLRVTPAGSLELVRFQEWADALAEVEYLQVTWSANLDVPAAQAVRQTSRRWKELELVSPKMNVPGGEYLDPGSLVFSSSIAQWTLQQSGASWVLDLGSEWKAGLRVRYCVFANPYQVVACPVILAAGSDPEFLQAVMQNGVMPEQAKSFLRAMLLADRSYWAR